MGRAGNAGGELRDDRGQGMHTRWFDEFKVGEQGKQAEKQGVAEAPLAC